MVFYLYILPAAASGRGQYTIFYPRILCARMGGNLFIINGNPDRLALRLRGLGLPGFRAAGLETP